MRRFFLPFLIAMVCALPGFAQEVGVLTVSGIGQVPVIPDMATVSLGVEVEADTANQAITVSSERMRKIIETLERNAIAPRDIQTSQFSLHPQWSGHSSSSSQPPKINGFVASNVVQVRVRQLDNLGPVLDSLAKSGANRIQGVVFGMQDPSPHLDKARQLAVKEAIRKAELFASAAGVPLGGILSITEGSQIGQPMQRMEMRAMSDAVPIAEGEVTLGADVTIRFALGGK